MGLPVAGRNELQRNAEAFKTFRLRQMEGMSSMGCSGGEKKGCILLQYLA